MHLVAFFLDLSRDVAYTDTMKRMLIFMFVVVPVGMIVSVPLAIFVGILNMFSSFVTYWDGIFVSSFLDRDNQNTNETSPNKEEGVWEAYQRRLDEKNNNTKTD